VAGVLHVQDGHRLPLPGVSISDGNTGARYRPGRKLPAHPIAALASELINPDLSV
jgi:hypothetical protein